MTKRIRIEPASTANYPGWLTIRTKSGPKTILIESKEDAKEWEDALGAAAHAMRGLIE